MVFIIYILYGVHHEQQNNNDQDGSQRLYFIQLGCTYEKFGNLYKITFTQIFQTQIISDNDIIDLFQLENKWY